MPDSLLSLSLPARRSPLGIKLGQHRRHQRPRLRADLAVALRSLDLLPCPRVLAQLQDVEHEVRQLAQRFQRRAAELLTDAAD